jgi:hypothetical protein
MRYSYTIAKKKITKADKVKIDSYCTIWQNCSKDQKRVYKNCRKEFFLNNELFTDLFKVLLAKKETDKTRLQKIIYDFFEKYVLEGGNPDLTGISVLGFVLTEYAVRKNLEDHYYDLFSNDPVELDHFVDDLKNNMRDSNLDFITIKNYNEVLWITFDEITDNPFEFLQIDSREEVYTALALSNYYRDTPIILFTISKDQEIRDKFKKATVFDAGSYPYFRPPFYNEKNYGYTHPHNGGRLKISKKSYHYSRQPEIICNAREIKYRHVLNVRSF